MSTVIIRDTREKQGWEFEFEDVKVSSAGLKYGDYTSAKLCDILRIERKASTGEIYLNLSTAKHKARFHRELEQLQTYKHAYIVCEFPESDFYCFPMNSGIPAKAQKKLKIGPKYLRKLIHEIEEKYDIEIVYCNNRDEAELFTYNIITGLERNLSWNG